MTTFEYDALGRLLLKSYSDGTPDATYTYDERGSIGRLTSSSNGTDTLSWTYDLAGQLLRETSERNASVVAYSYDLGGARVSLKLDGEVQATYLYDDASRLTSISRGPSVFSFGYDDAGRRTSLAYPNGATTSFTYDTLGQLTRLRADLGTTPVTDFQYDYDVVGNRTRKQQLDYAEDYAYDALSRLVGASRTGATVGEWEFGYDAVGNRTRHQQDASVLTASYDEKNRLLSNLPGGRMRWRGTLSEPGNVTFVSAMVNGQPARMLEGNVFEADLEMEYGANTVTLEARDTTGNVATQTYEVNVPGGGSEYTYDANGNLSSSGVGPYVSFYRWNAENQLTKVEKNGAEVARFSYDPLGRRVEKVAGDLATSYTYDWLDALREVRGSTTVRYVQGPYIDEPLAVEVHTNSFYLHGDLLGSVVKVTNGDGAVTSVRQYDAWGNLESGADQAGQAFTGREWDPEVGLYYYRARYYDPRQGRFLRPDPADSGGDTSSYSYVGNGPSGWRDPYGLMKLPPGPGGLGPEWTRDTGHRDPHGERFIGPGGEALEWNPAQPGKPGERGKDHWHWDPDGGHGKDHLKPGDEIPDPKKPACDDNCKRRLIWVPVLAFGGYVVYKTIVFWVCPPLVLVTP